jgi:hypothetical protein
MFVLVRAVTYAALFIGFVLVYLPARSCHGRALLSPQLPERRMERKWVVSFYRCDPIPPESMAKARVATTMGLPFVLAGKGRKLE